MRGSGADFAAGAGAGNVTVIVTVSGSESVTELQLVTEGAAASGLA